MIYEEAQHYALMRDKYDYSAQKLADKYGVEKGTVGKYWMIAKLPDAFPQGNDLGIRHLYELSKLWNVS